MCNFCEYYNCEKEHAEKIKEKFSVEICVKVVTYRRRIETGGLSSDMSRMFPIKYCPVCGKELEV